MKETIISITRSLWAKNIPFCLYRFPLENTFQLAVSASSLPHGKKHSFWITPFSKASEAREILLYTVDQAFINENFLRYLETVPSEKAISSYLPPVTSRKEYFSQIHHFLEDIHAGKLKKAILSRVIYQEKPSELDEIALFQDLDRKYPNTFTYLLHHPQAGTWLGASPERLIRKKDANIQAMVLAGTQKRKKEAHYHWRPKELEEHGMVGTHVEQVFEKRGFASIKKQGPESMETGQVAHLRTNYIFKSKENSDLRSLLEKLHPTPAIAGWPVAPSLECIKNYEEYDRKYYCGIIGQTNFDDQADLFVNLRCMQIGQQQIAIYVGGGITAASDPQEEWEETIIKSKTMKGILEREKELK